MTHSQNSLPHHRLIAHQLAFELATLIGGAAVVEIAGALRACRTEDVQIVLALASRVAKILSRLI